MAEVWDGEPNAGVFQQKLREATPLSLAKDILDDLSAAIVRFHLTDAKLDNLKDKFPGLPPEEVLRLTKPLLDAIESNYRSAHTWMLHALEIQLNGIYADHDEEDSYESRKEFVKDFNDRLR